MNHSALRTPNPALQWRAFTLIEMIGVMAAVALLGLALAPVLIRQLDRLAWEKEISQLKAFADGFRQGILKTKSIPNQTGWDQMIATNLGLEISQVRINERGQARVFLIDPAFQIDANVGLNPSYVQNANGVTNQPVNARLLIVSSLAKALPTNLVSGVASSAAAFSNIWVVAEGGVPAGWTWNGRGEDLTVQRIHLADAFLRLELNRDDVGGSGGRYSIEGAAAAGVPGPGPAYGAYFIDGTQLRLYDDAQYLEYSEILHRSQSFYFVLGTWRADKFLGRTVDQLGPIDLEKAAARFMASQTNLCAFNDGVTPWTVRDAMIGYMSNYVHWCQEGFPGCETQGNRNPSGTYGNVLRDSSGTQLGSQAYMIGQANGLICPQAN